MAGITSEFPGGLQTISARTTLLVHTVCYFVFPFKNLFKSSLTGFDLTSFDTDPDLKQYVGNQVDTKRLTCLSVPKAEPL